MSRKGLQIVTTYLQMMFRQSFSAFHSVGVSPVAALKARKKDDSVVKIGRAHV